MPLTPASCFYRLFKTSLDQEDLQNICTCHCHRPQNTKCNELKIWSTNWKTTSILQRKITGVRTLPVIVSCKKRACSGTACNTYRANTGRKAHQLTTGLSWESVTAIPQPGIWEHSM